MVGSENFFKVSNPAHDIIQYEKMKKVFSIEEFTSIINVTKHGIERLLKRKFSPLDVKNLIYSPDIIRTQHDQSKVFIKILADNKFNIIVYNPKTKSIITALKNINRKSITNIGKNYGWRI